MAKKKQRPLSSEEVQTVFRIIADLLDDTVEDRDWLDWDTWTPDEILQLARYTRRIYLENKVIENTLESLGVDFSGDLDELEDF